jgi:hypothetical protein
MNRFLKPKVIASMLFVFIMAMFVCVVYGGSFWQVKNARFSGTAGETLTVGQVVCIKASDNKIYKAKADDASLRPAVGVIGKGGTSGALVEIVTDGIIAGMSNATPGGRLYLDTTAGGITTSAPNAPQVIGFGLPGSAANVTTTYKIQMFLAANALPGY